jgi:hypothetical protein
MNLLVGVRCPAAPSAGAAADVEAVGLCTC